MKSENMGIACEALSGEKLAIVIAKNEKIIFSSDKKGISELAKAVSENKIEGGSAADRVIGKAAAMLLIHGKIKEIYAETISEPAIKILFDYNIPFAFGQKTEAIKNGQDLCPFEKLCLDIDSPEIAFTEINNLLEKFRKSRGL